MQALLASLTASDWALVATNVAVIVQGLAIICMTMR